MTRSFRTARQFRPTRAVLAALLFASVFAVVGPPGTAEAAKPVAVIRPAPVQPTVSADSLPTAQVDGVVWSIAANATTAYAGGIFTRARPAGAAPGVGTVTRNNLMAFDVTTGVLKANFAPSLNGQVKTVALSPDGTRLYIGGQFTSVDGVTRNRIAALNPTTGALITSFNAGLSSTVNSIAATDTHVYVGGAFSSANGVARSRLAAFSAATGALTGWAPTADAEVQAVVVSKDGTQVVAGGAFGKIGITDVFGMAALDATTGAIRPWAVNTIIKNYGPNSAILSLSTAENVVYGVGYKFGTGGNFEGAFAATMNGGNLLWLQDCHGDSYDVFRQGDAIFVASHAHACNNVGGFPERSPREFQRATAFAANADPNHKVTHNYLSGYSSFVGRPAPTTVEWFPYLPPGTYTGKTQAAWAVGGNDKYLLLGGEFPSVNGVAQQGIARFAVRPNAPNKVKPALSGAAMGVTAVSLTAGEVRVALPANYDIDDTTLTYELFRNPGAILVDTAVVPSTIWSRPSIALIDKNAPNGTPSYVVKVRDAAGNSQSSSSVTASVTSATTTSPYSALVWAAHASTYLRLGEAAGGIAYDWAGIETDWRGGAHATVGSGVTRGTAGAVAGNTAATLNGTSSGILQVPGTDYGPQRFTVQAWVKTNSTTGGQIIGFGGNGLVDRSLYMTNTGQLSFVVYDDAYDAVTSAAGFNNDQWHQVTGTLDASGIKLYVDGIQRAARTDVTSAHYQYGGWRVGGEKITGYPGSVGSVYFKGAVDEVAIYPAALTATQVSAMYAARSQVQAAPQQAPAGVPQSIPTVAPQPAPAVTLPGSVQKAPADGPAPGIVEDPVTPATTAVPTTLPPVTEPPGAAVTTAPAEAMPISP